MKGATVSISWSLEEWSASSDLLLDCSFESWNTRNWNAYGLETGQSVCSAERVTFILTVFGRDYSCKSDCSFVGAGHWDGKKKGAWDGSPGLFCHHESDNFDNVFDENNNLAEAVYCGCPCEDLVHAPVCCYVIYAKQLTDSLSRLLLGAN